MNLFRKQGSPSQGDFVCQWNVCSIAMPIFDWYTESQAFGVTENIRHISYERCARFLRSWRRRASRMAPINGLTQARQWRCWASSARWGIQRRWWHKVWRHQEGSSLDCPSWPCRKPDAFEEPSASASGWRWQSSRTRHAQNDAGRWVGSTVDDDEPIPLSICFLMPRRAWAPHAIKAREANSIE